MKPHTIDLLTIIGEYEDENGDFHEGTEKWINCGKCDVVPSGKADRITLPDGEQISYSYTIHLPKYSKEFIYGDKVRINFFGQGSLQDKRVFTVKGFHRYQLKCVIWV